jgi:hypothetical protein
VNQARRSASILRDNDQPNPPLESYLAGDNCNPSAVSLFVCELPRVPLSDRGRDRHVWSGEALRLLSTPKVSQPALTWMESAGEEDDVSDAPSWVAVGVSVAALLWAAWVDYRTRQETKRAAALQEQAKIDGAISRVVANWAATRLREVTYYVDPDLEELKNSAQRWRVDCREPLAVASGISRVYDLIDQTIKAVSGFEEVIDPIRGGRIVSDSSVVQMALTRMQNAVWESIYKLNELKGPTSQGTG